MFIIEKYKPDFPAFSHSEITSCEDTEELSKELGFSVERLLKFGTYILVKISIKYYIIAQILSNPDEVQITTLNTLPEPKNPRPKL